MKNRSERVEKLLKNASVEYSNKNYRKSFDAANEAWEMSPYDALAYMYRAFSHMWYSYIEEEQLYEQDIVSDLSICIDVGFEDGETDEYYEICRFCFKEYSSYMLFLLESLIDDMNEKKEEFLTPYNEQELDDEINNVLCQTAMPFEDKIESFWELALFSKISHIDMCPQEIFTDALNFIEKYRALTARYAFYEHEDKLIEFNKIKTSNAQKEITPDYINTDNDLFRKRINRWKHHIEFLNTAVNGKLESLYSQIDILNTNKKSLGFFKMAQKKELEGQVSSLQQKIQRYIRNRDFEIDIVKNIISQYEGRINS